jgi:opacity protein-like surface antigen
MGVRNLATAAAVIVAATLSGTATAQWYVSGNIGITSVNDADFSETGPGVAAAGEIETDTGWGFNGALGYAIGNLRFEAEISRRQADLDTLTLSSVTVGNVLLTASGSSALEGSVTTWGLMLNGWYDFVTGTPWVPTIGAGIGFADINLEVDRVGAVATSYDESDTVFAYQIAVGLGYRINPRTIVSLNYRYFGTSDPEFDTGSFTDEGEFQSHNFEVGVRYRF